MPFFKGLGRVLLIFGGILVLIGLFFMLGGKIPFLGKLPGDIAIKKDKFEFYFPLGTCILVSLGLTLALNLIFWLLRK